MPPSPLRPHIAIVGSGPSGCYTAQFLLREFPEAQITVLDRLPTPFGLVRYGVAPDHQGTKAVTRQFDRLFGSGESLTFLGNVEIGKTLSLTHLREAFDSVVLATGLWGDRPLGIDGETLPGVFGSGAVTRLINGHPAEQFPELLPSGLRGRSVVIGMGNVAMDLARFLSKSSAQYAGSDLDPQLLQQLRPQPASEITLLGRSLPHEAKCDPVMLKELADLPQLSFEIDEESLIQAEHALTQAEAAGTPFPPSATQRVAAFRLLSSLDRPEASSTVRLRFGVTPQEIRGPQHVTGITIRHLDQPQRTETIEADSVFSAIGYEHTSPGSEIDPAYYPGADLASGQLAPGLFCVGWLRRGPRGTIPENRKDAQLVAASVIRELTSGGLTGDKTGHQALPVEALQSATSFAGWERINAAEIASAAPDRSRLKIRALPDLIRFAAQPVPSLKGE